jgi:hypothetical protein
MTNEEISDTIVTFFLAGTETTASTLPGRCTYWPGTPRSSNGFTPRSTPPWTVPRPPRRPTPSGTAQTHHHRNPPAAFTELVRHPHGHRRHPPGRTPAAGRHQHRLPHTAPPRPLRRPRNVRLRSLEPPTPPTTPPRPHPLRLRRPQMHRRHLRPDHGPRRPGDDHRPAGASNTSPANTSAPP